jgi:TRAP-type mannitol/chloroaromatic compound transport system permease small subunit
MSKTKSKIFKYLKYQKIQQKHQKKLQIATVVWGVLMLLMGFVLVHYAVLPMSYQAEIDFSFGTGRENQNENYQPVFNANGGQDFTTIVGPQLEGSRIFTEENVLIVVLGWINFALPFAGLLAFAGIVYAGFLYVANFGIDEMTSKAKNIILYSVGGLVLIFSAYAIIATIIRASSYY